MAAPKVRVQKISAASEDSIDLEKWVKRCVVLRAEAEISARRAARMNSKSFTLTGLTWVARVLG